MFFVDKKFLILYLYKEKETKERIIEGKSSL